MVRLPHVKYIRLESCLFDTGSITKKKDGGNYIDPDHVEDNMDHYKRHISYVDEIVTLGDGKSQRGIKRIVRLPVCFQGSSSVHCATLDFRVFKTGHTCIVGLNAIKTHFVQLLIDMLTCGLGNITVNEQDNSSRLSSLWSVTQLNDNY
mgnify:FL=1